LFPYRSALSSRRPGQDKNPGNSPRRRKPRGGPGGVQGFWGRRWFFQLEEFELGSRQETSGWRCGVLFGAVVSGCVLGASVGAGFAAKDSAANSSGLPVPRYVSLKSDHVNVRAGPTKDNDVAWVYTRSGLPVEITAEFENWRRVRDSEGAEGWVYHSLLSGRRTAVITMKSKDELATLYDRADPASAVTARLQAGVVAQVKHCAAAGATSTATASTAGSNSNVCGASTPTRRWIEFGHSGARRRREPGISRFRVRCCASPRNDN